MRAVTSSLPPFSSLALLLPAVCLCPAACFGQAVSGKPATSAQPGVSAPQDDAVIFVNPLSQDAATLGIAYSKRISHAEAKADVDRLLNAGKWRLVGAMQIEDASVHPDQPKQFPLTTGVFFRVSQAPQVIDLAPNLRPYLTSFQRLNHFEVNFQMSPLEPYRGVTRAENEILSVQLQKGEGIYSFEVTIHNHKGDAPELVNTGAAIDANTVIPNTDAPADAQNPAEASRTEANGSESNRIESNRTEPNRKTRPTRPNILIGIAFALGVGLLAGGGAYLLLARQSSR